ncbi:MAG: hypothetical protein AB7V16_13360 [Vulcanibacillus sp.]
MKKLMTLFLVIEVLGIYGQTSESEIQAEALTEADTIQQVDTITLPDTIDVEKKLQTSDFELTEDSSIIKQNENDELKRKNNEIYCCCMLDWRGFQKRQNQDSSVYSIGYTMNVYPRVFYSLYDGQTFLGAGQDGYFWAGHLFCLFNSISIVYYTRTPFKQPIYWGLDLGFSTSFDVNGKYFAVLDTGFGVPSLGEDKNNFHFYFIEANTKTKINFVETGVILGVCNLYQDFIAYKENVEYDFRINRYCSILGVQADAVYSISNEFQLKMGMSLRNYTQLKNQANDSIHILSVEKMKFYLLTHSISFRYLF